MLDQVWSPCSPYFSPYLHRLYAYIPAAGTIAVCMFKGPAPGSPCSLQLRSLTLFNMMADGRSQPMGTDTQMFNALGNYASLFWNFDYDR